MSRMADHTSQAVGPQSASLVDLPLELRAMVYRHLVSRGPTIVYIKTYRSNLEPEILVFREGLMSMRLTCRQLYAETMPLINKSPILLRVESGVRLSTALRKLGAMAFARIGDLRITFHERDRSSESTCDYYNHFFDLGGEDIRTKLPELTKLTFVAPFMGYGEPIVHTFLRGTLARFVRNRPRLSYVQDSVWISELQLRSQHVIGMNTMQYTLPSRVPGNQVRLLRAQRELLSVTIKDPQRFHEHRSSATEFSDQHWRIMFMDG